MDEIRAPTIKQTAGAQPITDETRRLNDRSGSEPTWPQTETPQSKAKISVVMGGLLIAVALLFDGGQFLVEVVTGLTAILLPLGIAVSWAIDAVAWLTFFLWFHALGLGTIKKEGFGGSILNQTPFVIIAFALGIEFIPFVNALPAWTAAIVIVIFKERVVQLAKLAGPHIISSALGKAIGGESKTR